MHDHPSSHLTASNDPISLLRTAIICRWDVCERVLLDCVLLDWEISGSQLSAIHDWESMDVAEFIRALLLDALPDRIVDR